MNQSDIIIRRVDPERDAQAIVDIYNYYIEQTTVTLELEPITRAEMLRRINNFSSTHPYIVAEADNQVVGYAYAHQWKERAGYFYTYETTIYFRHDATGRGCGRRMLGELVRLCKEQGAHVLIACTTSENEVSKAFHRREGFEHVAHYDEVGRKFGRWVGIDNFEMKL